jgi:2,4-dienoyl-CoA reductase-like NADH-dependent reductase (Old Yellow Enzyme family)
MPYPRLFSPLRIGPHRARNRIVLGAHFTMFTEPARRWGEPGFFGRRLGRYLAERARGGAGVVIAGQAQVHPTSAYQMANNAVAWEEASVPHFATLTAQVHEHGALAFLQLAHNGGVTHGNWSKLPALAPSAIANHYEPPKVLEPAEIAELVAHFARSAEHAARGGFDGVEIHAAHGYLIHEFLSPLSNRRTDQYGGDLAGRMRFAVEVLQAVRDAVGPSVCVGVRLVGDEERGPRGGLTANDAAQIGAALEQRGLVDFINVSVGLSGTGMVRPMYAPRLFGVYAARAVKRAVRKTPVFAVHRILTPDEAESILASGDADAVTVVRALIADPDWPAKAAGGHADQIRSCTGCNQGCYGNLLQGLPVTCVTNPAVGREDELGSGTLEPSSRSKRVVVVGGGPAGLEAAWVAAARGHRVVLIERQARLGGKVLAAASLPGREEMSAFATWRAEECLRRGVEVRTDTEATLDLISGLGPDAVVVATGARASKSAGTKWHPGPVPGSEQDNVIDHEAALARPESLGKRVVLLDAVGHIEGVGLAELLAAVGREVLLVSPLPWPLMLDAETAAAALPRAVRAGATWSPNTVLARVGDHSVTLVDTLSGAPREVADVDHVVIRTHGEPRDGLYFDLARAGIEVTRVGDAVAARTLDRAIFDGHMAGRRL